MRLSGCLCWRVVVWCTVLEKPGLTPSGRIAHLLLQIRKLTASQMYKTLLTYDVLEPEVMEEVVTLLSDTDWWVVWADADPLSFKVWCWCVGFVVSGRVTSPQCGRPGISSVIGWESPGHSLLLKWVPGSSILLVLSDLFGLIPLFSASRRQPRFPDHLWH